MQLEVRDAKWRLSVCALARPVGISFDAASWRHRLVEAMTLLGACFVTLMLTATSAFADAPVGIAKSAPVSPDTARIELGRRLFFDKTLSADGTMSCASCHNPDKAFTDGRQLARGIGNQIGTRNTPTVLNAASNVFQFWDGRRKRLEDQVLDPFLNPGEHGIAGPGELVRLVRDKSDSRELITRAFGIAPDQLEAAHVAQALAAYIRTLDTTDSPFDRFLYAKQRDALAPHEVRGLELFRGRAQCASCHVIEEHSAPFADGEFHSLAIGFERIGARLPELAKRVAGASRAELDRMILSEPDVAALGRFAITLDPRDIGKFKTPSLRNVARTAPFMHDGSIATLEEAVEHEIYYRSQSLGRPLILTPTERAELIAFLRTLSGASNAR